MFTIVSQNSKIIDTCKKAIPLRGRGLNFCMLQKKLPSPRKLQYSFKTIDIEDY